MVEMWVYIFRYVTIFNYKRLKRNVFRGIWVKMWLLLWPGADSGGGGRTRPAPPPKIGKKRNTSKILAPPSAIEKIWFFGVKSWFFTQNTPKMFAPSSAQRNFLNCAPPNLKSWIRPWPLPVNRKFEQWHHPYQQNEQPALTSPHWTQKITPRHMSSEIELLWHVKLWRG